MTENLPGIDEVTDSVLQNVPEVQEHVVDAHAQKTLDQNKVSPDAPVAQGIVDRLGVPFDPAIHMTNADGSPKLTKTGNARRKTGVDGAKVSQVVEKSKIEAEKRGEQQSIAATAMQATQLTFFIGQRFGGDAGKPVKVPEMQYDEEAMMFAAYRDYFQARNITDFPPGVALSIALIPYCWRCFMSSPAKARTGGMASGIKGWFTKKILKKAVKDVAQHDSGNDGKRENNAGGQDGGEIPAGGVR